MKFIIFTHFIELTDLNLITIQITLRTMLTDLHLKTTASAKIHLK